MDVTDTNQADETPKPDDVTPPEVPATEEDAGKPKTIKQEVAERVAKLNDTVRGIVVEKLAGEEITKRAETVVKAVSKLAEFDRELAKIRPVSPGSNEKWEKLPAVFTNEQLKIRNETLEKRAKLDNALKNALDKSDYNKLNELVK